LNHETGALTGHLMAEAPKEFGKVYSQNITQDSTYGIATWTDGELMYLFRTGIKRDGQYAPPWMAKMPNMADEDIASIIAFLRSGEPMVAAAHVPDQPCEPSFLAKMLANFAFKPLPMPEHKIEMPDTNNAVELGKYLVENLDCFSCHSADFKTNDYLHPEKSVGYLAGGNKPLDQNGMPMLTQNLTPDDETGIGKWTEERFVTALKTGIMEGQPALRYPMVPFVQLTDQEAKSIYAYLRTVPPIKNKVQRSGL
jgi:mono/diheme cytochrome c family protein